MGKKIYYAWKRIDSIIQKNLYFPNTSIKLEYKYKNNQITNFYIKDNRVNYYFNNWYSVSIIDFIENAKVRPQIKDAKRWNKYCDLVCVGDFVKFTGQRNPNIWKKILKIDWNNGSLLCQQYTKPIDDPLYE